MILTKNLILLLFLLHVILFIVAVMHLYKNERSQWIKLFWTFLMFFIPYFYSILYLYKAKIENKRAN
jgi:magnesium-transporting ATPase (P-type)